ncbi:MAG: glycosyltransferase [Hyphomicrobium sp.]|uniref:glycosyltransferase n=1 Tax=Hyphomicrobium sp. TaxID=82 RepID=UPI0039E2D069
MRVAYLINQYPKVSHSFIRREIEALEREGIEVERIALRGWDGELLDPQDLNERARTRYVLRDGAAPILWAAARRLLTRPAAFIRAFTLACRMSKRSERPLGVHLIYLAEACRIAAWLEQSGARHLHAHFGTNSAEVAMLVNALGGPAWSFTVHGPEEFDKAPLLGLAEKASRAAFVVAISSYGRSQLFRLLPKERWPNVHVVHCGIDCAFYESHATPPSDTRRLVCVGRLTEQKGQLLLVEAARKLRENGIDFDLVLVGDGDMRSEIEALIARYELTAHVRITGWMSSEQVRAEILSARALVLPSFAEGLPVVLMEAMALGRPVISTYIAGIPELVRDDVDGWLAPAGDVDALTEAMRKCLDSPLEALASMGSRARARAIERHDAHRQALALATLFQQTTDH